MNFVRQHKLEILIFSFAVLARVFLFYINLEASDGNLIATIHGDDGYYELSSNILAGHGFSGSDVSPYEPNPLRTPVYPGFIALVLYLFGSYWAVVLVQILIGSAIPVLGRRIALRLTGMENVALWVGILLIFEPYLVLFSSIFYTETLFIFLFLVFVLLFISYLEKRNLLMLVLSSAILGLATLTKTTPQYLPIILLPLVWFYFRRRFLFQQLFVHAGLFLTVFLLVLSPWLYRNYRDFGVIGMTAQPAYNLNVYLVPSVLALENGTSFDDELRKFVKPEESSGNVITLANSSEYTKRAANVLINHPKGLFLVTLTSFITFFTHDGMLTVLQHAGVLPSSYLSKPALSLFFQSPIEFAKTIGGFMASPMVSVLVMRIFWVAVTIAFFFGSIMFVRKNGITPRTIFALLIVLYFIATTTINGLGVNARFRMPVNAIILTFAIYAILPKSSTILKTENL